MSRTLASLDSHLSTTLVVVVSKSGGTPEPHISMEQAQARLEARGGQWAAQAVAVTMLDSKLDKLAVSGEWLRRFDMFDWVGGRTSITSAVGLLPGALIGADIRGFLAGAAQMDCVTRVADLRRNPAALMAASQVSEGTSPMQTIRSPPAALLQAKASLSAKSFMPVCSLSCSIALFSPTVTSVSTVEGTWTLPTIVSPCMSTATTLVKVLPKSISSLISKLPSLSAYHFHKTLPYLLSVTLIDMSRIFVLAFVDESGSVVESYEYDAWGNVTVFDSGGTEIEASNIGNRYLFQGREYDSSTGLYYFRARWYDPAASRWLSKDPIGIAGGLNQYVFCNNNPVNCVDPYGCAFSEWVGLGSIILAVIAMAVPEPASTAWGAASLSAAIHAALIARAENTIIDPPEDPEDDNPPDDDPPDDDNT